LTTGGDVRCWGENNSGQLGNGVSTTDPTPLPQEVLSGAQAIAAGASHSCALMAGGGVRCWGYNEYGQLGDGTVDDRSAPLTDVLSGVQAISAARWNTCALTTSGGVRCWGESTSGQLGDDNPYRLTPAVLPGTCP
jgi:alpha-tubulin suppressor-like RCC1 family protein